MLLPARRTVNGFLKDATELDNAGRPVAKLRMETSVPGAFAPGAFGSTRTAFSPPGATSKGGKRMLLVLQ